MRIIDLSRELYHRTPTYPGHPPVLHGVWKTHDESFVDSGGVWGLASMFISMPDHAGTHIDAPRHFGPGGIPINEYPLEKCIVPGICLDLRHVAPRAEIGPADLETAVAKAGQAVPQGGTVLLCTGSIESPKLLMLSGLGAPQELERHGIAVRVALPGVGQNLQDHLLGAGNVYEASRPLPLSNYQHGEGMHYLRTDAKLPGPDLLLMFVTVPFASFTLPPPPANAYTILPCIMQPQSRGTIGLQSADPLAAPRIDPRYFRPTEVETLLGDAAQARDRLGWRPEIGVDQVIDEMLESDLLEARKQALLLRSGFG